MIESGMKRFLRSCLRGFLWFILGNAFMLFLIFNASEIKYAGVVVKRPINEQLRDWLGLPPMEKEQQRQVQNGKPKPSPTKGAQGNKAIQRREIP